MSSVYSDPVTQLAIVAPDSIDREARHAFRRLLGDNNSLPVILYYARVMKRTHRGRSVPRYLLISRKHWYLVKVDGTLSRCSRVGHITKMITCPEGLIMWKIPTEYDAVMQLPDAHETTFVENILHVLNKPNASLESLRFRDTLSRLPVAERPQLLKRSSGAPLLTTETPLPRVSFDDARRPRGLAEMQWHLPPPPPAGYEPAAAPSTKVSHTSTALQYLRGELAEPHVLPPDVPVVAPARHGTPSVASTNTTHATNTTTIRRVQPVSVTERVPLQVPPTPMPPLPPVPRRAVRCETEDAFLAVLQKLETRLAALERPEESLPSRRAVPSPSPCPPPHETGVSVQREWSKPIQWENDHAVSGRGVTQVVTPTMAEEGVNAAEFERSIASRPLRERLLLRGFALEERMRRVAACVNSETSHLALVSRMQEDLLCLVEAQRADERLRGSEDEKDVSEERYSESAEPHAWHSHGRKDPDVVDSEANDESHPMHGDFETWVGTDAGRRWYGEEFGEHRSACKERMVREILRHGRSTSCETK